MEVEIDAAAIYLREGEIGLLLLQNRPPFSGVTYSLCFKPYTGLGLQSGTRQRQTTKTIKNSSFTVQTF